MSKQESGCQIKWSVLWYLGWFQNGSGKISHFTNEVPLHRASHLHSFNYCGETGKEIPTVLVQPAHAQVKQQQQ